MLSAGCPHPTYLKPKVYHGGAKTLFLPVWDSNSFELCFWSGWFLTSSELFRAKICAALVGYVLNEHVLHLRGCEAALKEEELHVLFTFFFASYQTVLNQMLNFALVLIIILSSVINTPSVSSHSLDRVMESSKKWH